MLPNYTIETYSSEQALESLLNLLPESAVLIPLKSYHKYPFLKGWNKKTRQDLKDPDYVNLFHAKRGIGLLCGQASEGLVFIDIDHDEYIDYAECKLPALKKAPLIVGERGGKWLIKTQVNTPGCALRLSNKTRIGELLGNGQQGVVAGIHPNTQSPYEWKRWGEIPLINVQTIYTAFYCDY